MPTETYNTSLVVELKQTEKNITPLCNLPLASFCLQLSKATNLIFFFFFLTTGQTRWLYNCWLVQTFSPIKSFNFKIAFSVFSVLILLNMDCVSWLALVDIKVTSRPKQQRLSVVCPRSIRYVPVVNQT